MTSDGPQVCVAPLESRPDRRLARRRLARQAYPDRGYCGLVPIFPRVFVIRALREVDPNQILLFRRSAVTSKAEIPPIITAQAHKRAHRHLAPYFNLNTRWSAVANDYFGTFFVAVGIGPVKGGWFVHRLPFESALLLWQYFKVGAIGRRNKLPRPSASVASWP